MERTHIKLRPPTRHAARRVVARAQTCARARNAPHCNRKLSSSRGTKARARVASLLGRRRSVSCVEWWLCVRARGERRWRVRAVSAPPSNTHRWYHENTFGVYKQKQYYTRALKNEKEQKRRRSKEESAGWPWST